MASEYHGMSTAHVDALQWGEVAFLFIFTVEIFLKWLGKGIKYYFTDTMDIFDFGLVVRAIPSLQSQQAARRKHSRAWVLREMCCDEAHSCARDASVECAMCDVVLTAAMMLVSCPR